MSFFNAILLTAISLFFAVVASAHISLEDLPEAQSNNRFYDDAISGVTHPSLTLNGFNPPDPSEKG